MRLLRWVEILTDPVDRRRGERVRATSTAGGIGALADGLPLGRCRDARVQGIVLLHRRLLHSSSGTLPSWCMPARACNRRWLLLRLLLRLLRLRLVRLHLLLLIRIVWRRLWLKGLVRALFLWRRGVVWRLRRHSAPDRRGTLRIRRQRLRLLHGWCRRCSSVLRHHERYIPFFISHATRERESTPRERVALRKRRGAECRPRERGACCSAWRLLRAAGVRRKLEMALPCVVLRAATKSLSFLPLRLAPTRSSFCFATPSIDHSAVSCGLQSTRTSSFFTRTPLPAATADRTRCWLFNTALPLRC